MPELFDMHLRALRRDRAARVGPALFLFERAFEDCRERLELMGRRFERALLVGCPDPAWPSRLGVFAGDVETVDPGPLFAEKSCGSQLVEDQWAPVGRSLDLVLALGTLDTVNDLPRALQAIRRSLVPDGLFLGAMAGGDTLPRLRSAMRAADQVRGGAAPRVHPRIEASSLASLLTTAGFVMPVVDVDRISVTYPSLDRLIADLRAMGATNVLSARSRRPLTRTARQAAIEGFAAAGDGQRTIEIVEILHFAAWAPAAPSDPDQG